MSGRRYIPPRVNNPTPAGVVCTVPGAHFSNVKQRLYRPDGNSFIGRGRGIAIFTDGACFDNGKPYARAGMGVFFGPNSPYNITQPLSRGPRTSQRAEICAAILALQKASRLLDLGRLHTKHIVLISDSEYLVNSMTVYIYKWRVNGWMSTNRRLVTNRLDFSDLDALVENLEERGVRVRFWHVTREYNLDADEMAKIAAASG